jgi:hypothetical protein
LEIRTKNGIKRENGIRIEEKDVNRDKRGQEKELDERMEKGIGEKDGKRDRREKIIWVRLEEKEGAYSKDLNSACRSV